MTTSVKLTNTLLPIIRVCGYDTKGKRVEKYFTIDSVNDAPSLAVVWEKVYKHLEKINKKETEVNIYLIDKVNGEWRTDWELSEGGEILPHPWATKVAS